MGAIENSNEQESNLMNANDGIEKNILIKEYNEALEAHNSLVESLVGASEHLNVWIEDYEANFPSKHSESEAETIQQLQENVEELKGEVNESNASLDEKLEHINSL